MADEKKTLVEEDDDFVFGTSKKSGDEEETSKTDAEEDKSDDDDDKKTDDDDKKSDDDISSSTEDKSDDSSGESDNEEEKEDSGKDDDKSDDKSDDDDKKSDEENEDIFAEKTEGDTGKRRTLKEIGNKFGLELEKDDDDEEFETKLADKLSKSRQEINLDGYSDDAKALIRHLNDNEGDIESFFTNKNIIGLQSVLSLDAETKVRNVRLNELMSEGKTDAEAREAVDKEIDDMSTREIKDESDSIDKQARTLIQSEVKKMVGDRELKAAADKQKKEDQAIVERTNLKKYIEKKDNFLGLSLSAEAKKSILRDIDNGQFDKAIEGNPEERKFSAYMLNKHEEKILKRIKKTIAESNRAGHNDATKKAVAALHKTGDDVVNKKTGHQPGKKLPATTKVAFSSDDIE